MEAPSLQFEPSRFVLVLFNVVETFMSKFLNANAGRHPPLIARISPMTGWAAIVLRGSSSAFVAADGPAAGAAM
jgi:hypothetical protein